MKLHEVTEDWKQYLDGANLDLSNRKLKALPLGLPASCERNFLCKYNKLTSLQGAPTSVGGCFLCNNNKLTSLRGAPTKVGSDFYCNDNKLTTLHGGPTEVGRDFYCNDNNLTALHLIHEQVHHIGGTFSAFGNPLKGQVLGLCLIEGLTRVLMDNEQVMKILNEHLHDVLACQDALITAGLNHWAEL